MPRKNPGRLRFTPGFNYDLIPEIVDEMTDEYITKLTKKQRFEVMKIKKTIEERKEAEAKAEELRLEKLEKERKKQEGLEKKRYEEEKRLERQRLEVSAKRKEREQIEREKLKMAGITVVNGNSVGSGDERSTKKASKEIEVPFTIKNHTKIHFKSRLKGLLSNPKFIDGLTPTQLASYVDLLENKSKCEFDKLLLDCGYSRKTERDPSEVLCNLFKSDPKVTIKDPNRLESLPTAWNINSGVSLLNCVKYILIHGTQEQSYFTNLAYLLFGKNQDHKYILGFADFHVTEKRMIQQVENITNNIKEFLIEMRIPWRDTPVVNVVAAIEQHSGRIKRFADYMNKDKEFVYSTDPSQPIAVRIRQMKNELWNDGVWSPIINPSSQKLIQHLENFRSGK